jgi:excisionase family DNA binding protein
LAASNRIRHLVAEVYNIIETFLLTPSLMSFSVVLDISMTETELAAAVAIQQAKRRGLAEITPDELLLGCLRVISQFGIVTFGEWTFDLEALGVDWLEIPDKKGVKPAYSQSAVEVFDRAVRIAKAGGSGGIGIDHLLVALWNEETGLMAELKRAHGLTSAGWRAAAAQLSSSRQSKEAGTPEPAREVARDYLSPEQAAEALGLHAQTVRAYIRSGKLPAMRVAGERAIRIRREDLAKVLEPLN